MEEMSERMELVIIYWSWIISIDECQKEGIEVSMESIDEFLNWINENQKKLKHYGIFTI